jgi:hypothetical protein
MTSSASLRLARKALAAALLLGLGGCTLFDRLDQPILSVVGSQRTLGQFQVKVDCPGASGGELLIDGATEGPRFTAGQVVALDLVNLAEGAHRVEARVALGANVRRSAPLALTIDRSAPRLVEVIPAPSNLYYSRTPEPVFTATFQFDEPLDPSRLGGLRRPVTTGPLTNAQVQMALADAGRRLVITLDAPITAMGDVTFDFLVFDTLGNSENYVARWAWPASFPVTLRQPSPLGAPVPQTDLIDLLAEWPAQFGLATVRVDGLTLGEAASLVPLRWDSAQVPDGRHTLAYAVPGLPPTTFDIVTLNGRPRILSCQPIGGTASDASTMSGILVTFDREVCVTDQFNLCLGDFQLEGGAKSGRPATQVIARPATRPGALAVPADVTFTFERARSNGLSPRPDQTCTAHFPAWRRPLDPFTMAGAPIGEAFPLSSSRGNDGGAYVHVLRIASPASGIVERDLAYWDNPPETRWVAGGPSVNLGAGAFASQLVGNSWLETSASGVTAARYDTSYGFLTVGSLPLDPLAAPYRLQRGPETSWLEHDQAGRAQLRVASLESATGPQQLVTSPPLPAPAPDGSLVSGSVARLPQLLTAAVVEQVPGFPAMLQAWQLGTDGGWTAIDGVLNNDVSAAASEPTISGEGALAWVEAGQVWARHLRSAPLGGQLTWGPASSLNADPTAPAHLPRLVPLVWTSASRLLFVERGATGDLLQLCRFDDRTQTWNPPASLPLGGTVTDLSFTPGPPLAVLVTFDTGERTLLVYNE